MNSHHKAQRHHEDFVAFQKRFTTDVNCLKKAGKNRRYLVKDALNRKVFEIA